MTQKELNYLWTSDNEDDTSRPTRRALLLPTRGRVRKRSSQAHFRSADCEITSSLEGPKAFPGYLLWFTIMPPTSPDHSC